MADRHEDKLEFKYELQCESSGAQEIRPATRAEAVKFLENTDHLHVVILSIEGYDATLKVTEIPNGYIKWGD